MTPQSNKPVTEITKVDFETLLIERTHIDPIPCKKIGDMMFALAQAYLKQHLDKLFETKLIPLTQGKFAKVDAKDFEYLNQWKWNYSNGYAIRKETIAPNR